MPSENGEGRKYFLTHSMRTGYSDSRTITGKGNNRLVSLIEETLVTKSLQTESSNI